MICIPLGKSENALISKASGARLNIKMPSYQYMYVKYKTVLCLAQEFPHMERRSLYWDVALDAIPAPQIWSHYASSERATLATDLRKNSIQSVIGFL